MISPIWPSRRRFRSSLRASQWRHIRPTPTLRFFCAERSASASIFRVLGPSTVVGFSMKTLMPLSMAWPKWTQRNAQGVVSRTTSPGLRQSMAFL